MVKDHTSCKLIFGHNRGPDGHHAKQLSENPPERELDRPPNPSGTGRGQEAPMARRSREMYPGRMGYFREKSGIQGIYWVQFNRTPVKQFFKIVYLKFIIAHSNFVGITSDYRYLERPFERTFGHLNWYVFTVNSKLTIDELSKIPAVKVILTDLEGSHVFN